MDKDITLSLGTGSREIAASQKEEEFESLDALRSFVIKDQENLFSEGWILCQATLENGTGIDVFASTLAEFLEQWPRSR